MRRLDASRGLRRSARSLAALLGASLALTGLPAEAQTTAPDWAFGHPGGEVGLALGSALSLTALLLPQRQGMWGPTMEGVRDDDFGGLSDVTGNIVGSSMLATANSCGGGHCRVPSHAFSRR